MSGSWGIRKNRSISTSTSRSTKIRLVGVMTSKLGDRSLLWVRVVGGHGGENEIMSIMSLVMVKEIECLPPKASVLYPSTSFVVWEVDGQ
jgi:hypothetical protein